MIRNNKTDHNGIGIFMRDSTRLTATDNESWGNCVGSNHLFKNTPADIF